MKSRKKALAIGLSVAVSSYAALNLTSFLSQINPINIATNTIGQVMTTVATIFTSPTVGNNTNTNTSNVGNTTASITDTTIGTRSTVSQKQTVITTNANAVWSDYDPPLLYPNTITLPPQFITMPDGTKLQASVTLPADSQGMATGQALPVILIQTPYNTLQTGVGGADPYMVKHGYATVSVDVRGTGNSQGSWQSFGETEQSDYGHVVDWVTQQPWSNGNIGVYGISYLGITSVLTAAQQKLAIKAAFPIVPIGDGYRDITFNGGNVNPVFMPIWLGLVTALGSLNTATFQSNPQLAIQTALDHIISAATIFQGPMTLNTLLGGEYSFDGNFWSTRSPLEKASKINVPTFIVGGSKDIFQRSEPLWQEALKNHTTSKLLIGPWYHLNVGGVPTTGLPVDNVPPLNHITLRWFDQYVKGMNVGADTLPNVTQYVDGYDHYVTSTDWPHPQISADRLYLQSNHALTANAPLFNTGWNTVAQKPFFGLCSESIAMATVGLAAMLPSPCVSSNSISNIPAVVYNTAPLSSNYYLNGPIQADLWVSTTAQDTSVSVRLADYDPATGQSKPLSAGLLDASMRAVDSSRSRFVHGQMMQPWHPFSQSSKQAVISGAPMLMNIEVFPASAMIPAGHQLQVAISASNLPVGMPTLPNMVNGLAGFLTVYSNTQYPSSIVLPRVPTSALH